MSELVKEINEGAFDSEVLGSSLPALVDFWAPWCGPCRMLGPTIEQIAGELSGKLAVFKINVDDSPELAGKLGIMSIPVVMLFKGGERVEQLVGNQPKANLLAKITPHLG